MLRHNISNEVSSKTDMKFPKRSVYITLCFLRGSNMMCSLFTLLSVQSIH